MISADFSAILPEVVLVVYAMAALIGAVYTGKDELAGTLTWATVAVFVGIAAWIGLSAPGETIAFGGMFVDDAFARFAKVTVLLGAAAVLAMSADYMARRGLGRGDRARPRRAHASSRSRAPSVTQASSAPSARGRWRSSRRSPRASRRSSRAPTCPTTAAATDSGECGHGMGGRTAELRKACHAEIGRAHV